MVSRLKSFTSTSVPLCALSGFAVISSLLPRSGCPRLGKALGHPDGASGGEGSIATVDGESGTFCEKCKAAWEAWVKDADK